MNKKQEVISLADQFIKDVPGFPKPGIIFKDITPVFENPEYLAKVFDVMVDELKNSGIQFDKIVCPEARGFLFGPTLGLLTKNRGELHLFLKGWIKHLAFLIPIIGLLIIEPHLSASIVIIGICGIMIWIAGCKLWQIVIPGFSLGIPTLLLAIWKIPRFSHGIKRITTFLDPWQDKLGDGWQVIQSLYAIGSGGLFGAGLGQSKQKYLYLPEPQNDFIFSVLAEEFGFIGCIFVIILFGIFIWRGILIAMKAPDMFGSLVAVGITAMIGLQVIINIAVVTSSMPATGMPLPFFSYGGTALFIILCQMGVLLNISRACKRT